MCTNVCARARVCARVCVCVCVCMCVVVTVYLMNEVLEISPGLVPVCRFVPKSMNALVGATNLLKVRVGERGCACMKRTYLEVFERQIEGSMALAFNTYRHDRICKYGHTHERTQTHAHLSHVVLHCFSATAVEFCGNRVNAGVCSVLV